MQNRFYGDRKDVIKWSLALDAAASGSQIVYAAMMRPNDGPPGQDFGNPGPARADVVAHFNGERAIFGANGAMRTVDRIVHLHNRIHFVADIYAFDQQMAYFRGIADDILPQANGGHSVVLVDPDNGVRQNGAANNPHGRACADELAVLWQAMRRGDVLIVFQTPWRWDPGQHVALAGVARYDPPRALIANGLGIPPGQIAVHDSGDVGFLLAPKLE